MKLAKAFSRKATGISEPLAIQDKEKLYAQSILPYCEQRMNKY